MNTNQCNKLKHKIAIYMCSSSLVFVSFINQYETKWCKLMRKAAVEDLVKIRIMSIK